MNTSRRARNWVVIAAAAAVTAGAGAVSHAASLPGGVYVSRIGGTAAFGSGGTAGDLESLLPTYIDSFAGGGSTPQLTISLPTAFDAGTGNQAVSMPAIGQGGTNFAEGIMQLSPNGRYLALAGYPGATGTTRTASAASKTIGIVDVTTGSVNSTLGFNTSVGPRSVQATSGTTAYFNGSGSGIRYATLNSPATAAPNTGTSVSVGFATMQGEPECSRARPGRQAPRRSKS